MQHNWFTTGLVAVLAGMLGAVGFGVAGAQNDGGGEGVTINVEQPLSAAGGIAGAGGAFDGVTLVCPNGDAVGAGHGVGVGAVGKKAHGGGGGGGAAVAASANTNTLVNAVEVLNENNNANANLNQQEQQQVLVSLPPFFGPILAEEGQAEAEAEAEAEGASSEDAADESHPLE